MPASQLSIQTRTFESLGRLASGIMHEINTPVHYIGTNLEFLQKEFQKLLNLQNRYREVIDRGRSGSGIATSDLEDISKLENCLDLDSIERQIPGALSESQEGIDLMRTIAEAMKDFSHPPQHEFTLTDLNKCLETIAVMTQHEWNKVANLCLDLDSTLPLVNCTRDQIYQVILNLVVNAAQAVNARVKNGCNHKGTIIRAHLEPKVFPATVQNGGDHRGTIVLSTHAAGSLVEIRVKDNGTGIAPEHKAKIFTPSFTTKPAGEGTGQGLALSREIVVQRHRGALFFVSEAGLGTTFTIRLPVDRPGDPSPAGATDPDQP